MEISCSLLKQYKSHLLISLIADGLGCFVNCQVIFRFIWEETVFLQKVQVFEEIWGWEAPVCWWPRIIIFFINQIIIVKLFIIKFTCTPSVTLLEHKQTAISPLPPRTVKWSFLGKRKIGCHKPRSRNVRPLSKDPACFRNISISIYENSL